MIVMKARSLRELTRDELLQKHTDLKEERFNLNMRRSFKALDNPLRLRFIDREIARILTVLKEDDLGLRTLATQKSGLLAEDGADKKKKGE
jgi:large subunit ribosomal protein L29